MSVAMEQVQDYVVDYRFDPVVVFGDDDDDDDDGDFDDDSF